MRMRICKKTKNKLILKIIQILRKISQKEDIFLKKKNNFIKMELKLTFFIFKIK